MTLGVTSTNNLNSTSGETLFNYTTLQAATLSFGYSGRSYSYNSNLFTLEGLEFHKNVISLYGLAIIAGTQVTIAGCSFRETFGFFKEAFEKFARLFEVKPE